LVLFFGNGRPSYEEKVVFGKKDLEGGFDAFLHTAILPVLRVIQSDLAAGK
jgi:hypothetical protein